MHAVIRNYSGPGVDKLFDLFEERKAEIEDLIRGATGFVSYTLIRTAAGGTTITVCNDKAGTDESIQMARDWIAENAPDISAQPPTVSEGSVVIHAA